MTFESYRSQSGYLTLDTFDLGKTIAYMTVFKSIPLYGNKWLWRLFRSGTLVLMTW